MKKLIKNICWILAYLLVFFTVGFIDEGLGVLMFLVTFVLDLMHFEDGLFTINGPFSVDVWNSKKEGSPPKELIHILDRAQKEIRKATDFLDKEIKDEKKFRKKAVK